MTAARACLLVSLLVASTARADELTIAFGGDVMFGRVTARGLRPSGGQDPFAELAPVLSAADLAVVNLETPLCDAPVPPFEPSRHVFLAPPSAAALLAGAGVDLVSLANNHALDCGARGLSETLRALSDARVRAVGAGEEPFAVVEIAVRGARLAFLAATDRRNVGSPEAPDTVALLPSDAMAGELTAKVRAARAAGADAVIVVLHTGTEMAPRPSRPTVRLAHALVDAGAALVVGHHPHVLQAPEPYGDGLILYSTGNLVFDMRDERARRTAVLTVTFARLAGGLLPLRLESAPFRWAGRDRGPVPDPAAHTVVWERQVAVRK